MKQISRNKDTGNAVERYSKSFLHAIDGIIYAIRYEHNMIIIILAALVASISGIFLDLSSTEWLFVILIIGLVMASEMINTAIEAVVDLETLKTHPLAKIAKDAASSATLILSITALIGAINIYVPKIMSYMNI